MTVDPDAFGLPGFYCPFEAAIHPQADAIEQRAIAWIDQFAFGDKDRARLIATASAEVIARFSPNAITERIQAVANMTYWALAFDDMCDEGPVSTCVRDFAVLAARYQRVLDLPDARTLDDDPYVGALQDIVRTFRQWATPAQMMCWTGGFRAWLLGVAQQISYAERGIMPSLDAYLAMRIYSVAGQDLMMIEMANGVEVPLEIMSSRKVRALVESANLVMALDNDLISYAREREQNHSEMNIINVLLHENPRYSLQEAVSVAVALRDRILTLFMKLGDQLMLTADEGLRVYVLDIAHGIRAVIEWGLKALRYLNAAGLAPERNLISSHYLKEPSDPRTEPPSLASVSWWWEQLGR
ncbi:hypothetical protein J7I98_39355 [Streptomyces sp. ISL-98]|uniref:terpene synthase family protein n=1 Tax=Streptomyces sp. ISL-98 TaxID=2819192 RepID=UPI001BE5F6D5|nr:terpene synthase family protein [Streptomyces sp. ISL-98]MBT2511728.1 hypothetical protein [Streptomyces sp. ISL-98]